MVTARELAQRFCEIGELDVIELVMVDEDGDLWFEVNTYGVQF
jgi:hypothetical protein